MKIKPSEQGELKPMHILKGLPDELKEEKAFGEIEKRIMLIMKSDHTHRKVEAFTKCKRCRVKRQKRNDYIKEKGFTNYEQYLQWRKIMTIIKNKVDFAI